jgi:DNA-binding XRE family transcriptional regulator
MPKKLHEIQCSVCGEGTLRRQKVTQDIGDLLGIPRVVVKGAPALVCSKCGEVTVDGAVLEQVSFMLAARILAQSELKPLEARYVRKLLGYRQEDLAENLGVTRATVNRWETGSAVISGTSAYAIRSHVFFRLRSQTPLIEAVAPAFETRTPPGRNKAPYTFEAPPRADDEGSRPPMAPRRHRPRGGDGVRRGSAR